MSKKYPYTRHLPRTQLVSDKDFELEVVEVSVSASEASMATLQEKLVTWDEPFKDIPSVTATIVASPTGIDAEMSNVNVWIKSVTTKYCILCFSDTFTGSVSVQAIRFS